MGPVRRKIETCRQQRRNTCAYLVAAVQAHLADQPVPSLLACRCGSRRGSVFAVLSCRVNVRLIAAGRRDRRLLLHEPLFFLV
jgi:hypothetical protein